LEDEGVEPEEEELMSIISLSSSLMDRFGESSVDRGAADDEEVAGMEPGIVYVSKYNTSSGKTTMMMKMLMQKQSLLNSRSVRFDCVVSWSPWLSLQSVSHTLKKRGGGSQSATH
jgi:hypothetical protein